MRDDERKRFLTQAAVGCALSVVVLLVLYFRMRAASVMEGGGGAGLLVFGVVVVLGAWGFVVFQALQLLGTRPAGAREPAKPAASAPAAPKAAPAAPPEASALQMLSVLQTQGRLLDFLQEDLAQYEDAQIGAAVRSVHEGCKQAIAEHVKLEPVLQDEEGADVNVPAGFDPRSIRLTGNVSGNPPFRGVLRHRGWRVARVELPKGTTGAKDERVVAPAEVEIQG